MAITSGICNSFKKECLQGVHDFDNDVIKAALYSSSATLSEATTAYSATNEVTGTGYSAGGVTADVASGYPALVGSVAEVRFDTIAFGTVTLTARGVMLYNSSKSNKAILVRDFGQDVVVSNGPFNLVVPGEELAPVTIT